MMKIIIHNMNIYTVSTMYIITYGQLVSCMSKYIWYCGSKPHIIACVDTVYSHTNT